MAGPLRPRIMVVDDDPDLRFLIATALEDKYEVTHAHDGLDALEKLDSHEPDFIIMDMEMPLMDGLDACRTIRKNDTFKDVPVLFLSAHTSRAEITKTYESGGNLFLAKPIDPPRLLRNIDLFFEREGAAVRPKERNLTQIQAFDTHGTEHEKPKVPPRRHAPKSGQKPEAKMPPRETATPKAKGHVLDAGSALVPRILVVEDDEHLSTLMALALEELFEVLVCHDGLEAVEKIVRYQPDIVLIDIMLPKMNGFQLCQSLRANRAFARTPIFFVTAKTSPKDRDYAMRLGANGFIAKPFEMDELMDTCKGAATAADFHVRPKKLSLGEIHAAERRNAKEETPFDKGHGGD